jgi:hypothetical protein
MNRRVFNKVALGFPMLLAVTAAMGRERKGILTGTWDCHSHGGTQGESVFTLYLTQSGETVDGTISSPIGGTQISSGTFRKNVLEIHIDTPQGPYVLMGNFKKGLLSGNWSLDSDKGTWDATKHGDSGQ